MLVQRFVPVLQIQSAIEQTIANVINFLPTIAAVLVVLLVGFVVGRVLGAIVTRVVRRIGIDKYASGTAMEEVSDGDSVARVLGKIVAYYVYFVAILAAADILGIPELTQLLSELGAFLPIVLGAIVVLVVGFIVGRIVGDIVTGVVSGFGIGPYLQGTPLEQFGDTEGEVGRLVGLLVTYYIYLLTLLAVADILAITALSELLNTFAGYLPALVGGFIVLLVGIWVAELVGDLISEMDERRLTSLAGLAVKVLIYYITITIALGAIGFDITVLTTLFTAFAATFFGALALALAIGIGVAVGLGGQDYVAENVDDWMRSARATVEEEDEE